jgi:hypothetical protein
MTYDIAFQPRFIEQFDVFVGIVGNIANMQDSEGPLYATGLR